MRELFVRKSQERQEFNPRQDDRQERRRYSEEREIRPQQNNREERTNIPLQGKNGDTDKSILVEMRVQTDLLRQIADKEGLS